MREGVLPGVLRGRKFDPGGEQWEWELRPLSNLGPPPTRSLNKLQNEKTGVGAYAPGRSRFLGSCALRSPVVALSLSVLSVTSKPHLHLFFREPNRSQSQNKFSKKSVP